MTRTTLATMTSVLASTLLANAALAFPVTTLFSDTPGCDVLSGPLLTDELGLTPPFPVMCSIVASFNLVPIIACPGSDIPGVANALVRMTNTSGRAFSDLWYVGEPNLTFFTNIDGTVNGANAFKIDSVGFNMPLVFESGVFDGIFSPGETWEFLIDDYSNAAGLPPDAFTSLGVPSFSGVSSGSIIATAVPSPGVFSLLGVSGLIAMRRRR